MNAPIPVKVIIADDDPVIIQGLSMILSSRDTIEVIAEARNGEEAVTLSRELRPDVALLDIRMPGADGIEAAEAIIRGGFAAPLLLTTFDEPELISRALKAGAHGYILKNSPPERIVSAIETVARGGAVFDPDVIDYIRGALDAPSAAAEEDIFEELTPREREVARLVAEGRSNAEIAAELFISNGTVRNHVSTILEKAGLEHRTQIAVRYYTDNIRR
ncbi:MAG: response regulator transcription factor [Clostridiales Family XIII bacterium]|jgi:DNA-binding NarL/FixJ family response regulator|nr:response regulator transcription factor [Clostridiales Family XIII bacterium]